MTDQPKNAKDIFLQAIDRESSVERQAFLDQACDGDAKLRRRVEALLSAHDDPESYFDRPAARFDVTATFTRDDSGAVLSDSSSYHGRFLPGTKVTDRYRIVSLLGSGGMGDVYRADDLRLGQPVALKFLPSELAKDQKRLDYFHNEVKLARQVSHPNVCRVYDIGEIDGQHFISMEYIDGEDLKTLLHRIGRLPSDKGIQIAQQLCAGLAAAHAKGVLHRDLKPANIMIDGQGQVRITDFGLATVTNDGENVAGMSGTPAYMAPEQLLRGQSSIQSDVYSLGLVFFELFTGKATHQATSIAELRQLHEDSSVPREPKDIVEDIDPAVDRVISRCLDPDPVNRPRSISEISASLPGGQPLEAAIAAGETPSPELVAASGGTGVLSPKVATRYLIGVIVLLVVAFIVIPKTSHIQAIGADEWSPQVLRHRAREILRHLGIEEQRHSTGDFVNRPKQLRYTEDLAEQNKASRREFLRNGPLHGLEYWYRESPREFFPNGLLDSEGLIWNRTTQWQLRWIHPKMNGVCLSPTGQLRWFRYISERGPYEAAAKLEPDWSEWFPESITGIDLNSLTPATWVEKPLDAFDHYQAWEGTWPDTDLPLQVQAASFQGKPVFFEVIQPKAIKSASTTTSSSSIWLSKRIMNWGTFVVSLSPFLLAWYNYRRGRGDRRGAFRFAVYMGVTVFLANILLATHISLPGEVRLLISVFWSSAGIAFMGWVFYMAIEPLVRRYWPSMLISWTRLLLGSYKDPRVGRDLLVGTACGVALMIIQRTNGWYLGQIPADNALAMTDLRSLLGCVVVTHFYQMTITFYVMILFVVLATVFRSQRIALVALLSLTMLFLVLTDPLLVIPGHIIVPVTFMLLMIRYGVLATIAAGTVEALLQGVITTNVDAFYAANGMILASIVLAIAIYGFVISQGDAFGQKNFGST